LRDYGDNKNIVLYTEDNELYQRLRSSTKCFNDIPYWFDDKKIGWIQVGVDLYFPKRFKRWVEHQLEGKIRREKSTESKTRGMKNKINSRG